MCEDIAPSPQPLCSCKTVHADSSACTGIVRSSDIITAGTSPTWSGNPEAGPTHVTQAIHANGTQSSSPQTREMLHIAPVSLALPLREPLLKKTLQRD